jgi:hypothetical protein
MDGRLNRPAVPSAHWHHNQPCQQLGGLPGAAAEDSTAGPVLATAAEPLRGNGSPKVIDLSSRKISRAMYRLRHRMISRFVLPSPVLLSTYYLAAGCQRIRVIAIRQSARLALRLPPRLSR